MNALCREALTTSIDNEQDEYKRMLLFLALYRPPKDISDAIKAAYDAKDWDWEMSDGCTAVHEAHSPEGMRFPPCVRHDYDCDRATLAFTIQQARRIRAKGDKLFLRTNLAFRTGRFVAYRRYFGVRTYWLFIGQWLWKKPARIKRR